jgi:hypothetical protein
MKKKVLVASLREAAGTYPIAGEVTLNSEKQPDIEMWTGIDGGFLTVYYRNMELGVPLSNCKSLVWEPEKQGK